MRIAIDLQGAQSESRFRGIGRYSLSLAIAIARARNEHEVLIVLSNLFPESIEVIRSKFDKILPQENIRIWDAPGPTSWINSTNQWRREVAEYLRESFIQNLNPDVILITSLFEGYSDNAITSIGKIKSNIPTAVILYDLIPMLSSNDFFDGEPILRSFYFNKIQFLKQSDLLLAISQSAQNEAVSHINFPLEKTTNISGAYNAIFKKEIITEDFKTKLFKKFGIKNPFILYTGGADSRKNLSSLIQAFSRLPKNIQNSHQLVFVGHMPRSIVDDFYKLAKKFAINKSQFIVGGYIDDHELVGLYNLCKLFVFPSLHEGFGLPPLEAMACGTVVIGSNSSSLNEVIGHPEALFDPQSIESMSFKILEALSDDTLRHTLLIHGEKHSRRFSWNASAKKAINALERLYSSYASTKIEKTFIDPTKSLVQLISKLDNPPQDTFSKVLLSKCIYQNQPRAFQKKYLFIDISELIQRDAKTGIQRVVREILKSILKSPPEAYCVVPVYALDNSLGYRIATCFDKGFSTHIQPNLRQDDFIKFQAGDIFFGLDLQLITIQKQKAFLEKIRSHGVQIKFVVYDLLPVLMPDFFPTTIKPNFLQWLDIVTQSNEAICISKSVATELKTWVKENHISRLASLKIKYFSLGANFKSHSLSNSKRISNKSSLVCQNFEHYPIFLMVGTIEPRKGHGQVFDAFSLLWKAGYKINLLFVGKKGWYEEEFFNRLYAHDQFGKHFTWLQDLDDDGLHQAYLTSQCLIAASYGEGFGLPLIEAAQFGLQIFARDIPIFREVAQNYASYFSAKSPDELKNQIIEWLNCYESNHTLPQSSSIPYLSWDQSALQLLELICTDS